MSAIAQTLVDFSLSQLIEPFLFLQPADVKQVFDWTAGTSALLAVKPNIRGRGDAVIRMTKNNLKLPHER